MAGNNGKIALGVRRADSKLDIRACCQMMKQLHPHLDETGFLAQVMPQKANHGYALVFVECENDVAAAGYRIAEYLAWGRVFYVDDLVTDASPRPHGFGGALLDWLIEQARKSGCRQFHLDSGVQRYHAHRLYLGRKLMISSHHLSMHLDRLRHGSGAGTASGVGLAETLCGRARRTGIPASAANAADRRKGQRCRRTMNVTG